MLAREFAGDRARVPGLNGDRSDSIVGGALVIQAVMDRLLASDLTVAGYGLREGIALRSVSDEAAMVDEVQRASLASVGARFHLLGRAAARNVEPGWSSGCWRPSRPGWRPKLAWRRRVRRGCSISARASTTTGTPTRRASCPTPTSTGIRIGRWR